MLTTKEPRAAWGEYRSTYETESRCTESLRLKRHGEYIAERSTAKDILKYPPFLPCRQAVKTFSTEKIGVIGADGGGG